MRLFVWLCPSSNDREELRLEVCTVAVHACLAIIVSGSRQTTWRCRHGREVRTQRPFSLRAHVCSCQRSGSIIPTLWQGSTNFILIHGRLRALFSNRVSGACLRCVAIMLHSRGRMCSAICSCLPSPSDSHTGTPLHSSHRGSALNRMYIESRLDCDHQGGARFSDDMYVCTA